MIFNLVLARQPYIYTRLSHSLVPQVVVKNVSRLCNTKPVVTVNGEFPGSTIYVQEGDNLIINVTNYAQYNMSIHWYMRTHS